MVYGVRMNTKQHEVAGLVTEAMRRDDRSMKWTATKSGMAVSTFRRKVMCETEFTVSELARIARALQIAPCTLLPQEFREDHSAKNARALAASDSGTPGKAA